MNQQKFCLKNSAIYVSVFVFLLLFSISPQFHTIGLLHVRSRVAQRSTRKRFCWTADVRRIKLQRNITAAYCTVHAYTNCLSLVLFVCYEWTLSVRGATVTPTNLLFVLQPPAVLAATAPSARLIPVCAKWSLKPKMNSKKRASERANGPADKSKPAFMFERHTTRGSRSVPYTYPREKT